MLLADVSPTARQVRAAATAPPLCVDLDDTLINTDSLLESVVAAAQSPLTLLRLIPWLWRGRAKLKHELARRVHLDAATLPYNRELVDYLRAEKAAGRTLVLTTAADEQIASAVAEHLGLFDEVISSNGSENLKGPRKAQVLASRFGKGGFDYIGDARADIAVWDEAAGVGLANASHGLIKRARARYGTVTIHSARKNWLWPLLKAMRPHQWAKNILVFVPLAAVAHEADLGAVASTLLAFVSFCLAASGVYLSNDLLDLKADRAHARKRFRPLASGRLSLAVGIVAAPLLIATGIAVGSLAGIALLTGLYVIASSLYSMKLKELPLVDVFMLASLYTWRMIAGGVASGHLVSLWLLAFAGSTFLSLAFVKRVAELHALEEQTVQLGRRGYYRNDIRMLPIMGVAASFVSAIILALYVQETSAIEGYQHPAMLWATVPLLLFWQCRLWLSTARGYMNDDPIVYAARDRVSWLVGALLAAAAVMARLNFDLGPSLFLAPQ